MIGKLVVLSLAEGLGQNRTAVRRWHRFLQSDGRWKASVIFACLKHQLVAQARVWGKCGVSVGVGSSLALLHECLWQC